MEGDGIGAEIVPAAVTVSMPRAALEFAGHNIANPIVMIPVAAIAE